MKKKRTDSFKDTVARVKSLIKEQKYKEARGILNKIKVQEGLSGEDRLVCMLIECSLQVKCGEYKEALPLAEKVVQAARKEENYHHLVESLSIIAEIAWRLGELDRGLKAVAECEELFEKIPFEQTDAKTQSLKKIKADLLCTAGIIHWYKGNLDRAIEYHENSLEMMKELGHLHGMADLYNNLGLVYWSKGDLDRAIEYHQQSLTINEKIGSKRRIASSLNNLGNAYSLKGELDKGLEFFQRSLSIKMELDYKLDVDTTLVNIGTIYQLKGELDTALDYYQKSLAVSEETGAKHNIALAINNTAEIHLLRGEIGHALEEFKRCLKLYEELGFKQEVAMSFSNIAKVYWKRGNFEKALDYYRKSLAIYEEMSNDPYTAIIVLNLLMVALDREDTALAQEYLEKFELINARTDNKLIDQRYRIAKALSLKASRRTRHRLEAVQILEQVIKENIGDHLLAVTAMFHLCDLLLFELKSTGEEELFGEIKELTEQLLEIAQRQMSHSLLARVHLLQSKLALIELDLGQARKLLNQAHSIAEEKGLDLLARVIAQERDSLRSHVSKWESLIKQKPSKQEMIDITHIDVLLEQMVHKTVTSMMEETGISSEGKPEKKYELVYLDLLKDIHDVEKEKSIIGVAQIGLSKSGDIVKEYYEEPTPGLIRLREGMVDAVRVRIKNMVQAASAKHIEVLIFPELAIDLTYGQILEDITSLAKTHGMFLIPGSYHDHKTRSNLSLIVSPEGIQWEQTKHIPATIHFGGSRKTEGIVRSSPPLKTIIGCTKFGRIAVVICRDFLDMDLRVALKNAEPPVDIIINLAFTPVTDDFRAAHFDARRSIYAYCFFANVAEFGMSFIYTPENERVVRIVPKGEEGLIYKEIDLFNLRSERKKWEIEHARSKPFIQSTR